MVKCATRASPAMPALTMGRLIQSAGLLAPDASAAMSSALSAVFHSATSSSKPLVVKLGFEKPPSPPLPNHNGVVLPRLLVARLPPTVLTYAPLRYRSW